MPKTRPKHALSAWGLTEYFGGLEYTASAGIAQLVEHNLAKVGVAGSSPVSRSRLTKRPGFTGPFLYCRPRPVYNLQPHGQVAEWLCSGLQSRLPRFDSGPGLQIQAAKSRHRAGFFLFSAFLAACYTLGRSVSRPFLPEPAARAILAERMISAVSPSRARIMLPASQRRYDSAR